MTPEFKKVYDDINNICRDDWNNERARAYIVCKMLEYDKALKKQQETLELERKVHERVEAALAKGQQQHYDWRWMRL